MFWKPTLPYPRVKELRGWSISEGTHHSKPHWFAQKLGGIRMNTNSYGGIVSMILNRPY